MKPQLHDLLAAALARVLADTGSDARPTIQLDATKDAKFGDFQTNLALQLAKSLGKPPRAVAELLVQQLQASPILAKAEVAGPGFINFFLAGAATQAVVAEVLAQRARYGLSAAAAGQRVLVEFVSANPTGPLHVGHGRQAVLGDALSNLLATQGAAVHREFYYNDAGVQISTLALSVQARARGLKPGDAQWPQAAYNGDYIADIAADFLARKTVAAADGAPATASGDIEDLESIRRFAVAYLRREQDIDLQTFGVCFDQYYLESSLYEDGRVEQTVAALIAAGHTYEQDGALWLRTTDYGDDKDRVMRKSDGSYTYFVPDVAYHVTKWQRGFAKVINIQGSDHHGTIARVRAGLQALDCGIAPGYPDYVLHKMVTVMRGGEEVKLSKRAGSYVTVRDLIEWSGGIGVEGAPEPADRAQALLRGRDAVRFFLISRKADTEFVFDIDLALKQNDENPVYYVQYAHARICRVFRQLQERGGRYDASAALSALHRLDTEHEKALMTLLGRYPAMLQKAAAEFEPHRVAFFLREVADALHSYYNQHRFLDEDTELQSARLALIDATRQVIHNGLAILGVSAPEAM